MLVEVGKTLQTNTLVRDRAYRYGGDEFIILVDDDSRDHVRRVVKYLLKRFEKPWKLKKASPICRASIGIAAFPTDANTPDDLLHNADQMMYKAKSSGRGIACFYDGEIITPKD